MDKKKRHARATDLPGFVTPPTVRDIPLRAGSWGWVSAAYIRQDSDSYLWAKGDQAPMYSYTGDNGALLAWDDGELSVWVDPRGYGSVGTIEGTPGPCWVPVAKVLTEPPHYGSRPDDAGQGS